MTEPALQRQWDRLNTQARLPRWHPATMKAAWWAFRSLRTAKNRLARDGVGHRATPPPPLPWGARTGVEGVLKRTDPTCLERSVVWQAWLGAHGIARDVVVGVLSQDGVKAHAWIDGLTDPAEFAGYRVIHRIPPA